MGSLSNSYWMLPQVFLHSCIKIMTLRLFYTNQSQCKCRCLGQQLRSRLGCLYTTWSVRCTSSSLTADSSFLRNSTPGDKRLGFKRTPASTQATVTVRIQNEPVHGSSLCLSLCSTPSNKINEGHAFEQNKTTTTTKQNKKNKSRNTINVCLSLKPDSSFIQNTW